MNDERGTRNERSLAGTGTVTPRHGDAGMGGWGRDSLQALLSWAVGAFGGFVW